MRANEFRKVSESFESLREFYVIGRKFSVALDLFFFFFFFEKLLQSH
jgi:hypothetical protein